MPTDQPVSLAAALAALQADLPRIKRTGRAQVGTRKYSYTPYDEILKVVRPVLVKHGWLWHSVPTLVDRVGGPRFVLLYALEHLASELRITGEYPLSEGPAQQQGGQISYAKRYALVAVLDLEIVGEDDDGMPERTPAKIPGPGHERLRYGTVEPTPDDRPAERSRGPVDNGPVDKWTDQPPGNFDIGTPEDRPGSIMDPTRRKIFAMFRGQGITDYGVIHGIVAGWLGRETISFKQLSQAEGLYVIQQLKKGPGDG